MSALEFTKQPARAETAPARKSIRPLRSWLTSPRGMIVLAIVLVGGGLALGWSWLVAAGIAPLILSLAPCLAMCAVGACMMGKGAHASGAKPGAAEKTEPQDSAAVAHSPQD